MKRLNKLASLLLAVSMVFSAVPAMAAEEMSNKNVIVNADNQGGSGNVPVTLNVGDKNNPDNPVLNFSVTVPTTLPIHVDGNGVVTVAGGANGPKIINRSSGPVKVEAIDIVSQGSWLLADWSANLLTEQVNTKKYALAIQGSSNLTTDVGVTRVDDNNGTGDTSTFEQIPGKGAGAESSKAFAYNAHIAPQATDVTAEIANVVFTIGWDEATPSGTESKVEDTYNDPDILKYDTDTETYVAKVSKPILVKANIYYGETEPTVALAALEEDSAGTYSMRKAAARATVPTYAWSVTDEAAAQIDTTDCTPGTAKVTMLKANAPIEINCKATIGNATLNAEPIKFKGWSDEPNYTDFTLTEEGLAKFGLNVNATSFEIPAVFQDEDGTWYKITNIGKRAFSGYNSLTSITIPNSITTIEDNAFGGCTALTSITIPDSVISIGRGAFSSCHSLTSITIPDSVTEMSSSTFAYCENLHSITIPEGITTIGASTFYNCNSLKTLKIPKTITRIEANAFYACIPTIIIWGNEEYDFMGFYNAFTGIEGNYVDRKWTNSL